MRVVKLHAENFKRLQAVEITPKGDIVQIAGKNGQGKSSILDAIWVALVGRAVAPPKPIRAGTERCVIKLDLGDVVITRTFNQKQGDRYTDTLRVENDQGLIYSKPHEMLQSLMGSIGFDPFAFVQMKPDAQAETLMELVPLPMDLDESHQQDATDFANRRDINRDIESLRARVAAIPDDPDLPADAPDREAIADQLAKAADTNSAIQRDRMQRDEDRRSNERGAGNAKARREEAAQLRARADQLDKEAAEIEEAVSIEEKRLDELPALPDPVDTEALSQQLRDADDISRRIDRARQRAELAKELADKEAASKALTDAMAKRDKDRQDALAKAKMPIEGLSFGLNDKGKPVVLLGGVPFEQGSKAEQLRAATAIAMASNPELRVLRIMDGALLDDDSMAMLAEMAAAEDFQLWIEVVRPEEGVGIIIEDGRIKDDQQPESKPSKKGKAADEKPDGALL